MSYRDIDIWYSRIFREVVTGVDRESDLPVPWFTHNIWRDLQWTAYVGPCQGSTECLGFGLNLESTPTWRIVQGRVALPRFEQLLSSLVDIEWRWHARPRQIMKNPPFEHGGPYYTRPVAEVQVEGWLRELDDIIQCRRRWSDPGRLYDKPMRPQLQLMRCVGRASTDQDADGVVRNMQAVMRELHPMISYLTGGRR